MIVLWHFNLLNMICIWFLIYINCHCLHFTLSCHHIYSIPCHVTIFTVNIAYSTLLMFYLVMSPYLQHTLSCHHIYSITCHVTIFTVNIAYFSLLMVYIVMSPYLQNTLSYHHIYSIPCHVAIFTVNIVYVLLLIVYIDYNGISLWISWFTLINEYMSCITKSWIVFQLPTKLCPNKPAKYQQSRVGTVIVTYTITMSMLDSNHLECNSKFTAVYITWYNFCWVLFHLSQVDCKHLFFLGNVVLSYL